MYSELSRRRIRSINKLIRVGKTEAVMVMRVDPDKGYIDLSKRRVAPEDIAACEDRYLRAKTVRHVAILALEVDSVMPLRALCWCAAHRVPEYVWCLVVWC